MLSLAAPHDHQKWHIADQSAGAISYGRFKGLSNFQIGRRSSSLVFRSAGALSSPLSAPATLSAERRNLAARARHWLGQGIPVQAKGLDQLASEFVADLGHLSASPALMSGLNTLNKAGVAGNEVPNFW